MIFPYFITLSWHCNMDEIYHHNINKVHHHNFVCFVLLFNNNNSMDNFKPIDKNMQKKIQWKVWKEEGEINKVLVNAIDWMNLIQINIHNLTWPNVKKIPLNNISSIWNPIRKFKKWANTWWMSYQISNLQYNMFLSMAKHSCHNGLTYLNLGSMIN
jgi:hypothetical protein